MTTLLFLPGLLCDATVWAAQIRNLSGAHAVAVADYEAADTITAMAERALAAAAGPLSIAGHSMGARVALEAWRLAPDRVRRIALLSTGVHTVQAGEQERRMRLVALAREQGMEALCAAWLPPMVHPDFLQNAAMGPLRDMVQRFTPDRFAGQIAALLNRPDPAPLLGHMTLPVLVAVGREDGWSPPVQHKAIAAAIPKAWLRIFEHCGHMAPYEAPTAVTEALRTWMQVER